jgi:DNA-binding transcriptional LysR family regulator
MHNSTIGPEDLKTSAIGSSTVRLETLNCSLIQRRGARFEPTRAGEEVFRIASDIYGHVSRLEIELDERRDEVAGSVRLLSLSRMQSAVYDEFLADFHQTYPRIDLQIDKLHLRCFLRQRYAIFCGRHHRLFGRHGLSVNDLLAENFVSFSSDQLGDSLSPLTVFRDTRGFTGRVVAASSSLDEVRRMIFAGFGIGCLPEHIVRDDLAQQRLWRLPPDEGVIDVDIQLMWHRARKMNAAEQAFLDAMERTMQRYSLTERLTMAPT